MKIELSFEEILTLLHKKVSKPITLQYVNADTIAVGTSVKVLFKALTITINITIVNIDCEDIVIVYSGGNGLDLVISAILHYFDSHPDFGNIYTRLPNNQLSIHLNNITQLQSALNHVQLHNIHFMESGATITADLK